MQYLGEFLSPSNTIGLEEDKLIKYFYFRPDQYDDPTADLENIFKVKEMPEFPHRYDLLSENPLYAIDTIDVSKKLSDDNNGVNLVSYVVTCNYDLLVNIQNREDPGEEEEEEEEDIELDEDGNRVTSETPPWKRRAKWSWNGTSVVVPFIKGYTAGGQKTVDIKNTAGDLLIAETEKYRIEITYSKSYSAIQSTFDSILRPYVNSAAYNPPGEILKNRTFPAGTLLILVPQYTIDYFEQEVIVDGVTTKTVTPYHTYTITLIYDPDGWDKELLNVGTRAKFDGYSVAEDIYHLVVYSSETAVTPETDSYTTLAEVQRAKVRAETNGKIVVGERVTEPIPLTESGRIYSAAIYDPDNNPYLTLTFREFKSADFALLPLSK